MSISNIRKRLEKEKSFYVRIRRRSENGEYKFIESRIAPLNGSDNSDMAIIAVKDIDGEVLTEEKRKSLLILIFNQPIDKFGSYNPATRRQAPLPGGSPPAVAFLDWLCSICRLCLQND